ncbi:MAG: iron-sulfur cluster biosynthesis transcriptional regulator SufR [Cyanobacteria bacterium P01_H01_bin.121]
MRKVVSDSQVSSTKDDILQHLLRCEQATAQELADALTVTPQAIRRHLKDLEDEQLVLHQSLQMGMGRPQHFYKISPQGRQRFARADDQFAVSLLDTLAETVPPEQFGQILRQQWLRKAAYYREAIGEGPLPERLQKLVDLRRSEGYIAEFQALPEPETGSTRIYRISEYTCSIPNIAQSFPQVCSHELELFAAILADCEVERTHWLNGGEHRCGYLVHTT